MRGRGRVGRALPPSPALYRPFTGLLADQVPVCLNFTATERGPSPSANRVIAPANSRPSSSKLPPRGSCTARMATTISIAMHTAQIRVNRPSSTHPAPIVSTTMRITAVCVLLGLFTRIWAVCMAIEMVVAILAVQLPRGGNFELEGLLFAGAITLFALGDGPLSVAVKL